MRVNQISDISRSLALPCKAFGKYVRPKMREKERGREKDREGEGGPKSKSALTGIEELSE